MGKLKTRFVQQRDIQGTWLIKVLTRLVRIEISFRFYLNRFLITLHRISSSVWSLTYMEKAAVCCMSFQHKKTLNLYSCCYLFWGDGMHHLELVQDASWDGGVCRRFLSVFGVRVNSYALGA